MDQSKRDFLLNVYKIGGKVACFALGFSLIDIKWAESKVTVKPFGVVSGGGGACTGSPEVHRPKVDSTYQGWTPQGAGDNYVEVDEVTSDSDTTYVYTSTQYQYDFYPIDDADVLIDGGCTITGVTVHAYVRVESGTGDIAVCLHNVSGDDRQRNTTAGIGTSYQLIEYQWTTNPWTTNPWTISDFASDNIEFGTQFRSTGITARATQIWCTIEYTN